ncbi:MAG TPA: HEAT repeat domain-containing protein [Usitatibacter sp.]|nr:HEAT repeat domain-containing protein [Usitatibacter sp.]
MAYGLELAFASAVAAAALASALLVLSTLVLLRLWRYLRLRGLAVREERWREVLRAATEDPEAAPLPRVRAIDLAHFARCYRSFVEPLAPDPAANVSRLLQRHGMEGRLLGLLRSPFPWQRVIAVTALGRLGDMRAWEPLEAIARSPDPVLSFAAARALLRIDARRAMEHLAPAMVQRHDWPIARLGSLLEELGPSVVTPPLLTLLVARPRGGLDRVVKLARFGERARIATIVRGWLSSGDEPEVLMAALGYVEEPEHLTWVTSAARHADWKVRMAAARALGRVGGREELNALLELLRDPTWWVRYHAAQAVTRLRGLEGHELEIIHEDLRDAYASDMLALALAERGRRR